MYTLVHGGRRGRHDITMSDGQKQFSIIVARYRELKSINKTNRPASSTAFTPISLTLIRYEGDFITMLRLGVNFLVMQRHYARNSSLDNELEIHFAVSVKFNNSRYEKKKKKITTTIRRSKQCGRVGCTSSTGNVGRRWKKSIIWLIDANCTRTINTRTQH